MADTFTTNLNLTKPEVGASTDTWGTKINADLDALDAIFAVAGTAVNVKFASANFDDNAKAIFGTGDDLEIYHSGSHSIIKDGGTGNLLIQGDSVKIMNAAGDETFIDMPTDSHVALNYNNATKFQTSNTGATVTGTLVSDSLTVDTTTLVVDASNNLVGIGTSSPANKLEIQHGTVGTGNGSNNTLALRYNSTTLYGQHYMDGNGIYHVLADNNGSAGGNLQLNADSSLRFATGSTPTERMRIDSSGNVGIGETSPDTILHIKKNQSGANSSIKLENAAGGNNSSFSIDWQLASSGTSAQIKADRTNSPGAGDTDLIFSTSTTGTTLSEAMRIDSSGVVDITGGNLRLGSGANRNLMYRSANNDVLLESASGLFYRQDIANTNHSWFVGNTERMRLSSNGKLLLGTTTGTHGTIGTANKLAVVGGTNSTIPMVVFADADGSVEAGGCLLELSYENDTAYSEAFYALFSDNALTQGSISGTGNQTVSFNTSSDRRLKENIVNTESQLEKIKQIEVRDFNYIGNDKTTTGMIAQELNEIIPNVVVEGLEDFKRHPWSIDYGKITPYLIKAIQELSTTVDELKAEITTLKGE